MQIRRIITTAISALALSGAAVMAATPAFAGGSPVNVSASVSQTLTLSGITGSIDLSGNPGETVTRTGAEQYTVSSNDTAGYSVTVTPGSTALMFASQNIPNSALSVNTVGFSGSTALTVQNHTGLSAANGDSYSDTWALAIPGSQPAGTYTETFTYLALGK